MEVSFAREKNIEGRRQENRKALVELPEKYNVSFSTFACLLTGEAGLVRLLLRRDSRRSLCPGG